MKNNYIPISVQQEFPDLKYAKTIDIVLGKEKWQLVKNKDNYYQLYFGEGVQVDNMYEYGFAHLLSSEDVKQELERFINYRIERVSLNKFIGHKLNAFEKIYQFSTGKLITIKKKCIGVVLGISKNKVDIYDRKNPDGYKFYSVDVSDFKRFVLSGLYGKNNNSLLEDEKMVVKNYNDKLLTNEREEELEYEK